MRLLRFDEIDELDYLIYIKEWEDSGEKIVPMASARAEISFDDFLKRMRERETDKVREKGLVPATLYFLVDEKNKICGALDIRHELNEYLEKFGGHIGYGIAPSERKKGYGKIQLKLGLEKAKKIGLKKVLITCDDNNIGSAKTIEACGGIYNDTLADAEANRIKRYFVEV
ncbi:MAG: GNAT family N-acetyltransferase [Fusobacteriaceae bacterium]|mgnify:FL=1|jgi:predicted acetyltransferase|nr:GNAT family N-acetyltransferase [Fusobacteriaceae bacterium]MBP9596231.1 GNAT family N-acetyltransferase [Fusobacteriaceae bacterium]MBU9917394.1 GNAT family N-acetyltransferase [Fusobacteriaceae bacterium]